MLSNSIDGFLREKCMQAVARLRALHFRSHEIFADVDNAQQCGDLYDQFAAVLFMAELITLTTLQWLWRSAWQLHLTH